MLQPGTCSATRSSSSTCVGPPGARATHCATNGSSGGTTFGPPEPTNGRRQHRLHQIGEPVGIDAHVGVGVGDDLAGGLGQADVARRAQAAVGDVDDAHARVAPRAGAGVVARAVVDDDDLEARVGERAERREAVVDGVGGVVGADHHRHLGPCRARVRGANGASANASRTAASAGFGCRSASTRPNAQSRTVCPPRHHSSVQENAIAPHAPSANAVRMCIAVMRGLAVGAFADAVGAGFGEQQRPLAGDVLQPREVGAQVGLAVQVDVERADVEGVDVEILGRREVDVGEQALRAIPPSPRRTARAGTVRCGGWPCQRTTAGGISLPSAKSSAAGCAASARTAAAVSRRICRTSARSSRNATCCVHGTPAITFRPCRAASSSSASPGTV